MFEAPVPSHRNPTVHISMSASVTNFLSALVILEGFVSKVSVHTRSFQKRFKLQKSLPIKLNNSYAEIAEMSWLFSDSIEFGFVPRSHRRRVLASARDLSACASSRRKQSLNTVPSITFVRQSAIWAPVGTHRNHDSSCEMFSNQFGLQNSSEFATGRRCCTADDVIQ